MTQKNSDLGDGFMNGIRYDLRGHECIYLDLHDAYTSEAVQAAQKLGADLD